MTSCSQSFGDKQSKGPIIIALDGLKRHEAINLIDKLRGLIWGVKVNDLFFEHGMSIIDELSAHTKVFCDAKLHDIPNTVENTLTKLKHFADIFTVHASGGEAMIRAASKIAPGKVAAVTVLTSIDPEECESIYGLGPKEQVLLLAEKAKVAGATYMVCSGKELETVRNVQLKKIVPGIRPKWYSKEDDQKRVLTPAKAIQEGADYLVIGRPIVQANDPAEAAKRTLEEVMEAVNDD